MVRYCPQCMEPLSSGGCKNGCAPAVPDDIRVLRPGTVLHGRYLVGQVLGQGGFGITYIGRDLTLDIRVAIKEYFPAWMGVRDVSVSFEIRVITQKMDETLSQGCENFLNEARALARFRGEKGIVDVLDFFYENNTSYIVMEYIDGQTLSRYLDKSGPMPPDKVFSLMRPVMDSLDRLHRAGLIHRDISPDNIMITSGGQVKLLDFGTVRSASQSRDESMTIVLKHGYAPEEQYYRKGRQGPWTDVYALSATMYRCITGIVPADSLERRIQDSVQPPSKLGVAIARAQEAALMKGMNYNYEERFQSMGELAAALSAGSSAAQTVLGTAYTVPAELAVTAARTPPPSALRADNVLMSDRPTNLTKKPYRAFRSGYPRDKIRTITFLDTLKGCPSSAWDVSETKDDSVMAWVDPVTARMFIGGEGGVAAPADCSYMFAGYEQLNDIQFNGVFDTANATNMASMFEMCGSIKELDLSGFDTGHVTDMSCMFSECSSVRKLNLSGFDTRCVADMWYMFKGCSRLKALDLSSFDVTHVLDMEGMFYACQRLAALRVRNWNISNANVKYMFAFCSLAQKIASDILSGGTVST